ncbi:MAG: hypothetical protein KHX84_19225, partial [Enterocloster asparagiformis]|nr:hypothetical protein [Enterocloster asparagiformis]
HLTMDTLAFGYILPTTGRIPDLHRLETCAAGRTSKMGRRASPARQPASSFTTLYYPADTAVHTAMRA